MLEHNATQPRFYEVNGHTIYGVPPRADDFAARPLLRRDLRPLRFRDSLLAQRVGTLGRLVLLCVGAFSASFVAALMMGLVR